MSSRILNAANVLWRLTPRGTKLVSEILGQFVRDANLEVAYLCSKQYSRLSLLSVGYRLDVPLVLA